MLCPSQTCHSRLAHQGVFCKLRKLGLPHRPVYLIHTNSMTPNFVYPHFHNGRTASNSTPLTYELRVVWFFFFFCGVGGQAEQNNRRNQSTQEELTEGPAINCWGPSRSAVKVKGLPTGRCQRRKALSLIVATVISKG